METPLDILTRAVSLVREQEMAASVSSPSPSPPNSDHDAVHRHSSGAKRRRDDADLLTADRKKRSRLSETEYPTLSIQRSPPPAAPPVSAPSTLSPCSCCGGPVHYTLPVRPTPFSLASAHRLPYPGTTFPVNLPSLHYAGVPGLVPPSSIPRFKTSDGSAFSPILQTKVPPLLYPTPIPAFPYLERTSIACPLPVHPHTHAAAPPAAFPSFRHPSGSSRTEEKSKSAGDVRKGKSSSTDVDIDEHFKRSLQGDRLRQFYPYPTDDKGSVDNHFKRALGEEWNKVKSVETGGQDKNGSRVSIKTL